MEWHGFRIVILSSSLGTGGLSTIYQPRTSKRRLAAWELIPGKADIGALLEGNLRRTPGRRHRAPSTSRGKFRKLGQNEEELNSGDEETAAMLKQDSIDEEEIV